MQRKALSAVAKKIFIWKEVKNPKLWYNGFKKDISFEFLKQHRIPHNINSIPPNPKKIKVTPNDLTNWQWVSQRIIDEHLLLYIKPSKYHILFTQYLELYHPSFYQMLQQKPRYINQLQQNILCELMAKLLIAYNKQRYDSKKEIDFKISNIILKNCYSTIRRLQNIKQKKTAWYLIRYYRHHILQQQNHEYRALHSNQKKLQLLSENQTLLTHFIIKKIFYENYYRLVIENENINNELLQHKQEQKAIENPLCKRGEKNAMNIDLMYHTINIQSEHKISDFKFKNLGNSYYSLLGEAKESQIPRLGCGNTQKKYKK